MRIHCYDISEIGNCDFHICFGLICIQTYQFSANNQFSGAGCLSCRWKLVVLNLVEQLAAL